MTELSLQGSLDLHVHCEPDVKARDINDISMAKRCVTSGMRGFLIKAHDWSTHDRAAIAHLEVPECEVFGSVCMNLTHGSRVNPFVVKQALKTWGNRCRCIWLPTRDSDHDMRRQGARGISVVDERGRVLPEVIRTMELCAEADITLASGHCGNHAVTALAKAARNVGLHKFVVTHATSFPWLISPDNVKICLEYGAFIEHSYLALIWGPGTPFPLFEPTATETMMDYIRLCPEQTLLTTDLGSAGMLLPDAGLLAFMKLLYEHGFSVDTIDLMTKRIPAMLAGLQDYKI